MKNIQEIREYIAALFSSPCNFTLYLGFGDSEHRLYRRADFDDGATERVLGEHASGIEQMLQNEELGTRALSDLDDRANALFFYDIDDKPAEFATITEIGGGQDREIFSFEELDFSTLRTLLIRIASVDRQAVFVKQFYPVSLIRRDQTLLVLKDPRRFTTIDQDILKISHGFEVLLLEGEFYVSDFKKLDKAFGFDAVGERQKAEVIAKVLALDYLNDAKGHLAAMDVAKKHILRAKRSPVFGVPKEEVLAFVRDKVELLGLKVVDDKIQLTSAASVKRFMKLLNDDYLTSELTHINYDTIAKDELVAATE